MENPPIDLGGTFVFNHPAGGKKAKLKLTTLPHIFIHLECVSNELNRVRNPALAGVSFGSGGIDSASCPYLYQRSRYRYYSSSASSYYGYPLSTGVI